MLSSKGLVKVLRRLWKNDLVALKGACPNCGEEVFAFVRPDQPDESSHRADCHRNPFQGLVENGCMAAFTLHNKGKRYWRQR